MLGKTAFWGLRMLVSSTLELETSMYLEHNQLSDYLVEGQQNGSPSTKSSPWLPYKKKKSSLIVYRQRCGLQCAAASALPTRARTHACTHTHTDTRARAHTPYCITPAAYLLCMAQLERSELELQVQAALCRGSTGRWAHGDLRATTASSLLPPRGHLRAMESRLYSEPGS